MFSNYRTPINNEYSKLYLTRNPNEKYQHKSEEYNFKRQSNSLGISEKEISKIKSIDKIRVVCLGDSYTEGQGANKDSTYVSFLERSITKKKNIEFINAGRCGSDPFFDFKFLKDVLILYQPDIIIQSFTSNDLFFDMVLRGDNDRFEKNIIINKSYEKWWTPIYIFSYTSRIIIQTIGGYDKYLVRQSDYAEKIEKMKVKSTQLFKEYKDFTKENKIDLIVFTLPFKQDFDSSENKDFHKEINSNFSKFGLKFYDLQPCYEDYIKRTHSKPQDYYWAIDGHHNAKGYEMMAKCLEEIITPVIEKRLENQNTLVN